MLLCFISRLFCCGKRSFCHRSMLLCCNGRLFCCMSRYCSIPLCHRSMPLCHRSTAFCHDNMPLCHGKALVAGTLWLHLHTAIGALACRWLEDGQEALCDGPPRGAADGKGLCDLGLPLAITGAMPGGFARLPPRSSPLCGGHVDNRRGAVRLIAPLYKLTAQLGKAEHCYEETKSGANLFSLRRHFKNISSISPSAPRSWRAKQQPLAQKLTIARSSHRPACRWQTCVQAASSSCTAAPAITDT